MPRTLLSVVCFFVLGPLLQAETTSHVAVADNFGTGPGNGTIVGLGPAANGNVDAYSEAGVGERTFAIEFDVSSLPLDHTLIASATLQLTAPSFIDTAQTIDLSGYFGDGAVSLADVQGGGLYSLLVDDQPMSGVGAIDVTSFVQTLRASGQGYAGFFASSDSPLSPSGGAHPHVYSSEWVNASERPTLIVTTVPEPASALLALAAIAVLPRKRASR